MCRMCEENNGAMISCQDCGKMICFDVEAGDDIIRPAFVTSSGDLFCDTCGRYDKAEEEMMEAEAAYFPYDPMEEDCFYQPDGHQEICTK